MADPVSEFVAESHREKGARSELKMRAAYLEAFAKINKQSIGDDFFEQVVYVVRFQLTR
jgi:hypothetical protein